MTKRKEKGFTLLELIALLVIMSILALIVTPLVMNIIRKVRISADKRSVDAYGRSIELAIAGYLLDNGKFPTEVSQLTIEYSGDIVTCETTQINPDSSVYLAGCKVKNRDVTDYTYGTDKKAFEAYSKGDEVTYNGEDYYVIKDSDSKNNVVTLLKATPLTVDEVNLYGGVGTDNNHVNKYANYPGSSEAGHAYNLNGYGALRYYTREINDCWNYESVNCSTDYNQSDIKYVVDNWATDKIENDTLKVARLITFNDYKSLCEEVYYVNASGDEQMKLEPQYDWLHNSNYSYWTMTPYNDSNYDMYIINKFSFYYRIVSVHDEFVVRPVVELYKNDNIVKKTTSN